MCPPPLTMKSNPNGNNRQSHRLKGYDYSLSAPYFVTLCTENYLCLFGSVVDGQMLLNAPGRMIGKWLLEIQNKFPGVVLDSCLVMPNHVHAILAIMGTGLDMAARFGIGLDNLDFESADLNDGTPQLTPKGGHIGPPLPSQMVPGADLSRVIQWFKTMTTNEYIRGVHKYGWQRFSRKLWQRDYFDHIIRNRESLERIRDYIVDNPLFWSAERGRIGAGDVNDWLLENGL